MYREIVAKANQQIMKGVEVARRNARHLESFHLGNEEYALSNQYGEIEEILNSAKDKISRIINSTS